jgi:hypothetical protein
MSIGDETTLRTQLGAALDEFSPGPLPFESVIRQGRATVIRRRVLAAAAVILVAVAAVTLPQVARHLGEPPPSSPTNYHVTVNPPGKRSDRHLIGYGSVSYSGNNMRWSVSGAGSGKGFHLRWRAGSWRTYNNGQLIGFTGGGSWNDPSQGLPAFPSKPAAVFDSHLGNPVFEALTVQADVRYLIVSLSDGQTVTLSPVAVLGLARPRLVAIALPFVTAITEIGAYSARGELAYVVPFTANAPYNPSWPFETSAQLYFGRWLEPGQPALPRPATYKIGQRRTGSTTWSEYVNVGPWGTCVSPPGQPGSFCYPLGVSQLTYGRAARELDASGYQSGKINNNWVVIIAQPLVSYILAREPHGRLVPVKIYSVGGVKFATIVWTPHNNITDWIAYSAGGIRLASGGIS